MRRRLQAWVTDDNKSGDGSLCYYVVAGGGLPIIAKLWLHRRRRRDVVDRSSSCIVCRLIRIQ